MNALLIIGCLFFIFLQGCNQNHSTSVNGQQFKNYVNTNTTEKIDTPEETNQENQINPLVNVAF